MIFVRHVTLVDDVTGLFFDEILLFIGLRVWRLPKVSIGRAGKRKSLLTFMSEEDISKEICEDFGFRSSGRSSSPKSLPSF